MAKEQTHSQLLGEVTPRERALAGMALRLLLTWPRWIHRRTESIALADPETIRRRIAVDFTIFADLPSLIEDGNGQPIHFVPIALLKKQPLTNFDLRDESERALPLLTRQRNGDLATAMLVVLAEGSASDDLRRDHGETVPAEVGDALRRIATQDSTPAQRTCDALADASSGADAPRAWLRELAAHEQFMSLANALATNFVVTVPLPGAAGVRRIIKYGYEERFDEPALAPPKGLRNIGRILVGIMRGRKVKSRPPTTRGLTIRQWLARGMGWMAKSVVIETPSVTHGASYHLEIEAPEGLDLTHSTLKPHRGGQTLAGRGDSVNRTLQRMHLYVSGLPAGTDGAALANLRPSASTIIRAAWMTAVLTTMLLAVVAIQWRDLVENLAALPSLLLVVPTGAAAYVARSREPKVTTSVLFGLRLLALSCGLWSFLAALVLVVGRTCSMDGKTNVSDCTSWGVTPWLLWGLVGLSAVTLFALSVTYARTTRPPEQD